MRPPFPTRVSRISIFAWLTVLTLVVIGFSWVAVKSYDVFHTEPLGASKLAPVKITGSEQTVFKWKRDACEQRDIPDAPARAFRDAGGNVHLLASHYVTRQAIGRTLGSVKHRCDVVMRSAYDSHPSHYQDREWLFTPYTIDGRTIWALVHNEYHGNDFPGRCLSLNVFRCWNNAVTLARSDDGGATFQHARPAPRQLVATIPYRYRPDVGFYGVFSPSNIVKKGDYYYSLAAVRKYKLQLPGACLMRTKRLDDPTAWRAWGGEGFDTSFVNPYATTANPRDHVCEPVSPDAITDMSMSLTYNTYFGKYLLVAPAGLLSGDKRRTVYGFYYSLSDDLIHWSPRKLIREVELVITHRCGDRDPVAYPSVIDPHSKSPNFETSGKRAYLYFTRMHYEACSQTLDRDLVRVPIEFSK